MHGHWGAGHAEAGHEQLEAVPPQAHLLAARGDLLQPGSRRKLYIQMLETDLKSNLVFLRSPACSELGDRYKSRQGLLAMQQMLISRDIM